MRRCLPLALVCLLLLGAGVAPHKGVVITKNPPKVEYRYFDPAKPPPEMPKPPDPDMEAYTNWSYASNVAVNGAMFNIARKGNTTSLEFRLTSIEVTLDCTIVLWLPEHCRQHLKLHEEGHRILTEHYYASADQKARAIAEGFLGKKGSARGPDRDQAFKTATDKIIAEIHGQYTKAVNDPAARANAIFDELTRNGARLKPTADEAVVQSILQVVKEQAATTRPTTQQLTPPELIFTR